MPSNKLNESTHHMGDGGSLNARKENGVTWHLTLFAFRSLQLFS